MVPASKDGEARLSMGTFILIFVIVFGSCAAFAVLGTILGSRIEAKNVGSGIVETDMRSGLTASVVGGLLGIIPFLVFIILLIVTVITNPAHPDEHGEGGESGAAEAH